MSHNYYTTTYLGYTVHVVEAKATSTQNVQISVMGLKYDVQNSKKTTINWRDTYLDNDGWTRVAAINGSLFFDEGLYTYANGIQKIGWSVHENDDSVYDPVMAIAHGDGPNNLPIINTTSNIRATLDQWIHRGAITGAFGLLRNGSVDQGNTSLLGSYSSVSGRSIVGKKSDGTIVFASVAGVTGSTGLTGGQTLTLAQNLDLSDAIAMDGGGSVGLVYDEEWKVSSSRPVKNAILIYAKDIDPVTSGKVFIKVSGSAKQVTKIYTKVSGTVKQVNKLFIKINGILKQIF